MMRTGHEIKDAIVAKQMSAVEATRAALAHAEALEPALRAYIRLLPERALAKARAVDAVIKAGADPGPLGGVPLAVKDLFCVDGEIATAGSKILENFRSPYSATVVTKLEAAGAIIIGKTNMDEFAMGSSCENSAFFPTHNPWDVDARARRVLGRQREHGRRRIGAHRLRHRHRWVHPRARIVLQCRWRQADLRPGLALRHDRFRLIVGPGRPDDGRRARCRTDARRSSPDTMSWTRPAWTCPCRTTPPRCAPT